MSTAVPPPDLVIGGVIRPDRCEKCKFASMSPNNPELLDCHRHPPTVFAYPLKDPKTGNIAMFQHYTCMPQVHPANHCGEFKPRIEGIN